MLQSVCLNHTLTHVSIAYRSEHSISDQLCFPPEWILSIYFCYRGRELCVKLMCGRPYMAWSRWWGSECTLKGALYSGFSSAPTASLSGNTPHIWQTTDQLYSLIVVFYYCNFWLIVIILTLGMVWAGEWGCHYTMQVYICALSVYNSSTVVTDHAVHLLQKYYKMQGYMQ